MTVERADWLFSDQLVERPEGGLAGKQTSRHEQVNKLARHQGEIAGKPVLESERITTVDGITGEGLCLLFGGILSGRDLARVFDPGRRSVWGFDPRRIGLWRLSSVCVILSYGIFRDFVGGNYVLAKIG